MSGIIKPSTHFGDQSAPDHGVRAVDSILTQAAIMAVAFALSPIAVLTLFFWYFLIFTTVRWSWKFVAACTVAYSLLFVIVGGFHPGLLHTYMTPWREMLGHHSHESFAQLVEHRWLAWVGDQIGLSILLGSLAGTLLCAWRWIRRPVWEDWTRAASPVDMLRKSRTVKAIRGDKNGPNNGLTVGIESLGRRVVQLDTEGAAHALIAGGSGSGKTTTMMVGMRDVIRRGHGLIVVDLKGGPDVPGELAEWAARYGRRFLHWSITDPRQPYIGPADGPAFYDPMGRGDPSRRKDLFIGSQKWDVEYYKGVVGNYVQLALTVAAWVPNPDPSVSAIDDLATLLDPRAMMTRASALLPPVDDATTQAGFGVTTKTQFDAATQDWAARIAEVTDPDKLAVLEAVTRTAQGLSNSDQEISAIRNAYSRLQTLTGSTAGAWLRRDPDQARDIDLRATADDGFVVVFSLDSSNYEETSAQIAGLIIQDLKTLTSELRQEPASHPVHVYVDEFAAVGSDNILGLLNKARDARMPVSLSTQALADLRRADPAFVDQVLGIVNTFIIHRANTEEDATVFAGLTGKTPRYMKRMSVAMASGWLPGSLGRGAATGMGMIEEREEYRVMPSQFQDLAPGELVYVAKAPVGRVVHPVQVIRENLSDAAVTANRQPHPRSRWGKPDLEAPTRSETTAPDEQPLPVPPPVSTVPAPARTNANTEQEVEQNAPAPEEQPLSRPHRNNPLLDPKALRGQDLGTPVEPPRIDYTGRHSLPELTPPTRPTTPATPPARVTPEPATPDQTSAPLPANRPPWLSGDPYATDELGTLIDESGFGFDTGTESGAQHSDSPFTLDQSQPTWEVAAGSDE